VKTTVSRRPVRVPGFRFAGVRCGLKEDGKRDVALIVSDRPAAAAGAFTRNRVRAAPVRIGQERLRAGRLQAIVINSGNANAYTGPSGDAVARAMTATVARALGIPEALVVPSSTGKIGVPLPRARVLRGVRAACRALDTAGFAAALEGMMTTDAFPKFAVERVTLGGRRVTIAAMAKGAGMIAPNMATLLTYVLTDACVSRAGARQALRRALPDSFNAIVVDGDTSTNDTAILLANGVAGNAEIGPDSRAFPAFAAAVARAMRTVARLVVKDGEGATKVVDIRVRGAASDREAARVADTIARSPLCKTAFYGGDPYAGRLICAAGYSGADFSPDRLNIFVGNVAVVRRGRPQGAAAERRAARVMARPEFAITLDLHCGRGTAYRVASDLTAEYVHFNSAYRT